MLICDEPNKLNYINYIVQSFNRLTIDMCVHFKAQRKKITAAIYTAEEFRIPKFTTLTKSKFR